MEINHYCVISYIINSRGLSDKTWLLIVKFPSWNKVLHTYGIIAGTQIFFQIQLICFHNLLTVNFDSQAAFFRKIDAPSTICIGSFMRRSLPSCQIQ